MWFSLIVIAAVVAAVGLVSGGASNNDPPRSPNQEETSPTVTGARADVEITACSVSSETSWPEAALRVTNNSSKTSNYVINVEFVDSNNVRIAEGFTAINNLAAGQVASEKANGFTDTSSSVVCRITDVTRHAS
ncbi:FxLYD domain-containing protein [Streptomyces sp. NPDC047197]|uniref:FxLYD domain-containing protein n=1 Tax=Streptomyces sp. NPDC047197 TaxID=3155477 RepID=UPI0033C4E1F0